MAVVELTWTVVLKIGKLSVAKLLEFGGNVVSKMTGQPGPPPVPNPYFNPPTTNPIPSNPTIAGLGQLVTDLNTANNSPIGGKPKTIAVGKAKVALVNGVENMGKYVGIVANIPSNLGIGDAIIVSAGMEFKKKGTGFKPDGLTVKNNKKQSGSVLGRDVRLKRGTVYSWYVKKKTDLNFGPAVFSGTAAKFTFIGLNIATIYPFQTLRSFPDGTTSLSAIMDLPII